MHYAVKQSLPDAEVVCAFDINTVANDVYQCNHGKRPYQVWKLSQVLDKLCLHGYQSGHTVRSGLFV